MKHKRPTRIAILTGITAALFALSLIFMVRDVYSIFQYTFLMPILLSCFWFRRAGIIYSAAVAVVHTLLYALFFRDNLANEISLSVVFIIAAVFADILLEKLDREVLGSQKLSREIQTNLGMMQKAEELSGMGSWRLSLTDDRMIWSDGLYRIFGLDPAVTVPSMETRLSMIHPDDRRAVEQVMRESLERGRDLPPVESRIIRPDGALRWILSTGYTECDSTGKPVTYIGSLLDITDRKAYEHRIDEESEKLRITLASIGDGVIATDQDGNVTLLNRQAGMMTGWNEPEARGKPFGSVFRIGGNFGRQAEGSGENTESAAGEVPGCPECAMLVSRHGEHRAVSISSAPIKSRKGVILGRVIVFRDITEEKKQRDQIDYISYHDALTGLYNRRFFDEQLKLIDEKDNLPISVIMGDLNGLKVTNDAFGHEEGDRLIWQAAQIIRSACRETDIVSRWGGDEFVVLLPKTGAQAAETVVSRIAGMEKGRQVGLVSVSISLGTGTMENENDDILHILSIAEGRMYAMKTQTGVAVRQELISRAMTALFETVPEEQSHAENVAALAKKLGKELAFPAEGLRLLRRAGYYHDIGKIAAARQLRDRREPRKVLSFHKHCLHHPEIGYEILRSCSATAVLADDVLCHHERYDGQGYPKGISGDAIPPCARIIAVANAFDHLLHPGSGQEPLSEKQAAQEIAEQAGTQFDPRVTDALTLLYS